MHWSRWPTPEMESMDRLGTMVFVVFAGGLQDVMRIMPIGHVPPYTKEGQLEDPHYVNRNKLRLNGENDGLSICVAQNFRKPACIRGAMDC